MASAPPVHRNEEAQLLTQNEGPIATRLRSASTPGVHLTEEAQLLTQNEGPIATRLRSRSKVGYAQTSQTESTGGISVNNQSADKPSQLSRHQKDKRNNSMAKKSETHTASTSKTGQPSTDQRTKESNDPAPKGSEVHISSSCTTSLTSEDQGTENNKDSSETQSKQNLKNQHAKSKASQPHSETKASSSGRTSQNSENQEPKKNKSSAPKKSDIPNSSSDVGQEKEKTSISSQKPAKQTIKEDPVYRIRFEGFEKPTTAGWNCELCEKDLAHLPFQEELGHSLLAEDELEYSFFLREEHQLEQYSLLPEAAVLPCSHVYHSVCLSAMPLSDPPCPICLSLL